MGLLVAQVIIDDSSDKTITGRLAWDRDQGGILIPPSGTSFPPSPENGELFWRTDLKYLYRRSGVDWIAVEAALEPHGATHGPSGVDSITIAQSQVTDLVSALANKVPDTHIEELTGVHPRLTNILSTGLVCGGEVTINGSDPTKFDVADGCGVIVDNYTDPENPTRTWVEITAQTAVTPVYLSSSDETYIYVDVASALVQQTSPGHEIERRDLITIGWVSHLNRTDIDAVYTEPYTIHDAKNDLQDFVENFGAFNVEGNDYGAAGALELFRTAGKTFDAAANYPNSRKSPNVVVTSGKAVVSILYFYRDALGEWVNNVSVTTDVDPNYYDAGAGKVAVPSGKWTIQPIMFYAPWETTNVQYGQVVYDTVQEARAAIQTPVDYNPYNAAWDTFRGWLIVKQGATDLTDPDQAVLVPAGKLGLVSISSGGGAGGEINTASNTGTAGVGVFDGKIGVDLQFRKLNPASTKLSVVENSGQHRVDIDVVPGNIAHGGLSGVGTNTHAQVDTHLGSTSNPHSVTKTQVGLGSVTDDAQLKRAAADFAGFTTKATPVSADVLLIEDSADSNSKKKVTVGNLPGSVFGVEFQQSDKTGTESVTGTTWTQYWRFTTTSLPPGTYRIGFFHQWAHSSVSNSFESRVVVDGSTAVLTHVQEPQDPASSQRNTMVGFGFVTFATTATHTVDFEYRGGSTTSTAWMHEARVEVWKVS